MEFPEKGRPMPSITSLQDLEIVETFDQGAKEPKITTFFHITPDGEVSFGESTKKKMGITLDEYRSALPAPPLRTKRYTLKFRRVSR